MTEAEWLACTDPEPMLKFLKGKASDRKLRLFTCACCRRASNVLDEHIQTAVELAERNVDEPTALSIWAVAEMEPRLKDHRASQPLVMELPPWWDVVITMLSGQTEAVKRLVIRIDNSIQRRANDTHAALRAAPGDEIRAARAAWAVAVAAKTQEQTLQCRLLRCIIGNPFCPIILDSAWLTWHDGLLVSMARLMYESRDFTDMPILADALEEAGCTDQEMLWHCRQQGAVHVRGCWVMDLILGKE
jgi:hypothetical protein